MSVQCADGPPAPELSASKSPFTLSRMPSMPPSRMAIHAAKKAAAALTQRGRGIVCSESLMLESRLD